jgi:hypothetical protein
MHSKQEAHLTRRFSTVAAPSSNDRFVKSVISAVIVRQPLFHSPNILMAVSTFCCPSLWNASKLFIMVMSLSLLNDFVALCGDEVFEWLDRLRAVDLITTPYQPSRNRIADKRVQVVRSPQWWQRGREGTASSFALKRSTIALYSKNPLDADTEFDRGTLAVVRNKSATPNDPCEEFNNPSQLNRNFA